MARLTVNPYELAAPDYNDPVWADVVAACVTPDRDDEQAKAWLLEKWTNANDAVKLLWDAQVAVDEEQAAEAAVVAAGRCPKRLLVDWAPAVDWLAWLPNRLVPGGGPAGVVDGRNDVLLVFGVDAGVLVLVLANAASSNELSSWMAPG